MISFLANLMLRGAALLGLYSLGASEAKKREAFKRATEAYDEAQRWANRSTDRDDIINELRRRSESTD